MGAMAEHLQRLIAVQGPISLARYMAEALGHPRLGYYMTRDPLGGEGDFITAPEVNQIFGELIGLWALEGWRAMGSPAPFTLAEFGPGRGTLMADALRAARLVPDFEAAAQLALVETSPALRARQAALLGGHDPVWYEHVAQLPPGPLIAMANEFLDALPLHQFQFQCGHWHERMVADDGNSGFAFALAPEPTPLQIVATPQEGFVVELAPAREALVQDLARRLVDQGGLVLVIDYGPQMSGFGDTFQAVSGHRFADPLADPGAADLTSHVDFARLVQAGESEGAAVYGPREQGEFLLRLGLRQRLEMLVKEADAEQTRALQAGARRLVAQEDMGGLFKVLCLADPELPPPPGFEAPG